MAPGFTAKLGAYDFAQYVRVGPGEGLDPYGQAFEDPVFQDVAGSEGQPLLGVDIKNREQVFPLYLNAASKDALHTLIRDLGREIRYGTQPQRLEWKDKNATSSTFYDVTQARFEPNFSFRQSEHGWFAGSLHVWSQPPYGHTATERIIATGTATAPIVELAIPSIAGDVNALANYQLSGPISDIGELYVFAVAAASYRSQIPAGSMVITGGGTSITASGAIASRYIRSTSVGVFDVRVPIPDASMYDGANRILGVVRCDHPTAVAFNAVYDDNTGLPTTVLQPISTTGLWRLIDLGTLRVDARSISSYSSFSVGAGIVGFGSAAIDLTAVYLLPEDTTTAVQSPALGGAATSRIATMVVNGTDDTTILWRQAPRLNPAGSQVIVTVPDSIGGERIGPVPQLPVQGDRKVIALALPNPGTLNSQTSVSIAVRERFVFAR